MTKIITIKIGAEAGQGAKSAGSLLAKLAVRSGYQIFNHTEYPSLIRGGHNVIQVNISKDKVTAPRKVNELLVALNQDTINKHAHEFAKNAGVIYDANAKIDTSKLPKDVTHFEIPFSQLGESLYTNTIALGAITAIFGGSIAILGKLIAEEFGKKGDEVIKANRTAAEKGFDFILENYKEHVTKDLAPMETLNSFVPDMVLNGNDAVAMGAIASGLQFAAIYPMSPISSILQILAENQEKFGYVYKQPEDEISAITMAIGASFAGARAMTATSGGGFCLMTEGFGLAGMTETPLVIIEGMRPGPATGLPTWSDQGDLQMILNAHQGDFPRIVLAAGDTQEAFDLTMQAFNLADKYQTPVVLLVDKNICESDISLPLFDSSAYKIDRGTLTKEKIEDYKRFELTDNGISTRSMPGTGNFLCSNSDEHDEYGFSTEESDLREKMMEKRMGKLEVCRKEDMQAPVLYGPKDADVTIVSWGSNKGNILEALKSLKNTNFVHITWVSPFPAKELEKLLKKSKFILNVECNYTGHMARLISEQTNIKIDESLLKYDGRPIYPEEIIEKVKKIRSSK